MNTIVRKNERSWAIELISKINGFVSNYDIIIKKAGGESTLSQKKHNSMFPDVLLYGDEKNTMILQGWELKMPDVPIEDAAFIADAQRKALALDLNSCLIWNFTYAVLYMRQEDDSFEIAKAWDATSFIKTRDDVAKHEDEWSKLLEEIILEINDYFANGTFRKSFIGDVISSTTLNSLIQRNQSITAETIQAECIKNSVSEAHVSTWWADVHKEYEFDETNKYYALSKNIILDWAIKITFAHLIKYKQNGARLVDSIEYDTTPQSAMDIFGKITSKCDFYNIFYHNMFGYMVNPKTWDDLVEYSLFLRENGIDELDQSSLQRIMEGSISVAKRSINGQFTTPSELAKILVRLTVLDWNGDFYDCCCGTGTIAKAAISIKKSKIGINKAVETVWASDKYKYPLQIASISMTSAETVNLANRLFNANALTSKIGDKITLTDPQNGKTIELALPQMESIATNLPFVRFENLPVEDYSIVLDMLNTYQLNAKSDLYCYIALKIADLLKENGRLGIITSNSWLGTESAGKFIEALKQVYEIKQVHISGKGRWFHNADVVTTIMILQKVKSPSNNSFAFYLWKKKLEEYSENKDYEECLINSALLGKQLDESIVSVSQYTWQEINDLMKFNISYNALFHKVDWLNRLRNCTIQINTLFKVSRGSRRGWDPLFFPANGTHQIEEIYLRKVLKNARNVDEYVIEPDGDAFCCSASEAELNDMGHYGALQWIKTFENQNNNTGKPLKQVLKQPNLKWYEMTTKETAEIFTIMNPDKRFFFGRFKSGSAFVNQRLIALTHRDSNTDIKLYHALLNSVLTAFSIESSGFGRGLGVLDVNSKKIKKCIMFNPDLLSFEQRKNVIDAFDKVQSRGILSIEDDLKTKERMVFEKILFEAYGIEDVLPEVITSIRSMQKARETVKT